ncbi:TetR/AcrR family transcriptional regulator [Sphingobium terrigena]|jgi:TetR/AcrR family transcriptional regulator|uniref:TetR/AcrR family transcriptional regulator n=1 Tax=Sphingobium terrigena TaxID=2304063 RepID=A0A418YP94_9SPHN|nr:TetR/AcrR family transcriptional regulator [Sphingobium terrigena]RJG53131.1 TetR/AcrR family transcriptional regulator [Sphingobium terrigena]
MSDMRSQLLETAARLFAERGYEAVSMRNIARLVGVTQANLYYHFRDKADLIEATLASVFEACARDLDAWLAQHPSNQLEAFVRWFVRRLMTDRIFARLLYRELLDGDEARIATLSSTVLRQPFQSIVAAVEQGRTDISAKEVALSLVGFALGQVLILPLAPGLTGDSERSESVDQVASQLLALIQSASVVG